MRQSAVLKPERASESPGSLARIQVAGPALGAADSLGLGRSLNICFGTSFLVMLMLLVWGTPHETTGVKSGWVLMAFLWGWGSSQTGGQL